MANNLPLRGGHSIVDPSCDILSLGALYSWIPFEDPFACLRSWVEFKRISLTGFRSCTSRSRYRSISKQITRISQVTYQELDNGSEISIVTVNTKEYHSDVLAIITRIMRRT
ncbi:hypothetical protein Tco_0959638 [Tanacetum coccineum]